MPSDPDGPPFISAQQRHWHKQALVAWAAWLQTGDTGDLADAMNAAAAYHRDRFGGDDAE
jgi:hypothetical protein